MPQLSTVSSKFAEKVLCRSCKKELVVLVAGKRFAQLLQGPFSGGMFGDIEVNEASGSDLKRDKDVKRSGSGP
jgi:hypothetical protein